MEGFSLEQDTNLHLDVGRPAEPVCEFKTVCACGYLEAVPAGHSRSAGSASLVPHVQKEHQGG